MPRTSGGRAAWIAGLACIIAAAVVGFWSISSAVSVHAAGDTGAGATLRVDDQSNGCGELAPCSPTQQTRLTATPTFTPAVPATETPVPATATAVPPTSTRAPAGGQAPVTALPSTGSGSGGNSSTSYAGLAIAAGLALAGAGALRLRKR